MTVPVLAPIAVFVLLPAVLVVVMSLHDWNLIDHEAGYVALDNYAELVRDRTWWQSLAQTAYFAALTVPVVTALGLLLAWSIFRRVGTRFVEVVLFAPYVLPPVATMLAWVWIFGHPYGALNAVLARLGVPAVDWLGDPRAVVPAMALYGIWQGTGFSMVLFLAALARIPREVFEAAALDGARGSTVLRRLVLPLVSPTTYVVLLVATVGAFKAFTVSYLFTSGTGGPGLTGLTVSLYQYQHAFVNFRAGYGSAISVALGAVLLAVLGIGMALGRRKVFHR